jgi:predicted membrane-bound mannosyltransferase
MAGSPSDPRTDTARTRDDTAPGWLRGSNGVVLAVVGVTIAALLARVVFLGARPAHYDEARVAYWALYAQEEGHFAYRSIVHGPFVQHADRWLFGLVDPTDFTMRIPVAIVGGLFPLSALLFRDRLRAEETVALSLLLAFNPVLLYYSRFMRSDVLVAAFMFTALGMLVRLLDRRNPRYLYGAVLFLALGIASKENSAIYLLTWVGAGALVLDRALDAPGSDRSGVQRLSEWGLSARTRSRQLLGADPGEKRRVLGYAGHGLAALALFGLLWLFMFAPRGDGLYGMVTNPTGTPSIGLWEAVGDPGKWFPLVDATWSQFAGEYLEWGDKAGEVDYLSRLSGALFDGLLGVSPALILLAVAGFVRERYAAAEGRVLVFFLCYAGAASLLGYPLGLSIGGGWKWNNAHILVPLALPAAVGLGVFYRWGREAFADDDPVDMVLTALILLLVITSVAWSGLTHVYTNPQHESNELVQFAQPYDDLDPMYETLQDASDSDGLDAIVYSETGEWEVIRHHSMVNAGGGDQYWNVRPACTDLSVFLPAHWYFETADVNATCETRPDVLKQRVDQTNVPVVVTKVRDDTVPREWLRERFTHVGNFSLRWTERADPTLEVWSRAGEN